MKTLFNDFYHHFKTLEFEKTFTYFSLFAGIENLNILKEIKELNVFLENNFIEDFQDFKNLISPSYLLDKPYVDILMAVALGDGKYFSVLKRAKIGENIGKKIINELVDLNILIIEKSREAPLRTHPKNKLKKALRSYRIQDKLRFRKPYFRFWFGFVQKYYLELSKGQSGKFLENFKQHNERLYSLVYEQLCDVFLTHYYTAKSPIIKSGSYWDRHSEFDILAQTQNKQILLAECKCKERKICKNELGKLKLKALQSNIKVDMYILFSKNGFSKELLNTQEKNLLLFDFYDLKEIIY